MVPVLHYKYSGMEKLQANLKDSEDYNKVSLFNSRDEALEVLLNMGEGWLALSHFFSFLLFADVLLYNQSCFNNQ